MKSQNSLVIAGLSSLFSHNIGTGKGWGKSLYFQLNYCLSHFPSALLHRLLPEQLLLHTTTACRGLYVQPLSLGELNLTISFPRNSLVKTKIIIKKKNYFLLHGLLPTSSHVPRLQWAWLSFQLLRPDTYKAFPLLPLMCFLTLSNTSQELPLQLMKAKSIRILPLRQDPWF